MTFLITLLVLIVALDLAASLRGFDSRDTIDSPEWERRKYRQAFL